MLFIYFSFARYFSMIYYTFRILKLNLSILPDIVKIKKI